MVGVVVAVAAALSWAVGSTILARQMRRVDALSAAAIRSLLAMPFFVVIVFALGAADEFARMRATDLLQFIGTGVVNLAIGESLYGAAVVMIGLTRAYTMVVGVYNLTAFLLAAALLGETLSWKIALGAIMVLLGVYLVALYGRVRQPDGGVSLPVMEGDDLFGPAAGGRRSFRPHLRTGRRPTRPPIRGGDSAQPSRAALSAAVALPARTVPEVRILFLGRLPSSWALGVALAIFTGLAWGCSAVWLRSAAEGFDAAAVSTVRLPVAALLLALSTLTQPASTLRRGGFTPRQLGLLGLSGILGQGVASVLFVFSLQEVGAGKTVVLFSTAPLFALPLGAIFLREQITIWVAVGTVLAVGGIALLV